MTIGYLANSYAEARTIIGRVGGAVYAKFRNWDQLIAIRILGKFARASQRFAALKLQCYNSYHGSPKCDVLHCFNTTCWTKTPWVVTFETMVPRFAETTWAKDKLEIKHDQQVARALKQLAKPSCLGMLALSECAAKMQRDLHARYGLEELDCKLHVLHPPQRTLVDSVRGGGGGEGL